MKGVITELFSVLEIRREPPYVPRRSRSRKPQQRVNYLPNCSLMVHNDRDLHFLSSFSGFPLFKRSYGSGGLPRLIFHYEAKTSYNSRALAT